MTTDRNERPLYTMYQRVKWIREDLKEALKDLAKQDATVDLGDCRRLVSLTKLDHLLATITRVAPFSPAEVMEIARLVSAGVSDCTKFTKNANQLSRLREIESDLVSAFKDWYPRANESDRVRRLDYCYAMRKDNYPHSAECVGRWESRGGKYWVELIHGVDCYSYTGNGYSGDVCCGAIPLGGALAVMQSMVDRGMFLPDKAVLPMKRFCR